jgi:hypothetical protein
VGGCTPSVALARGIVSTGPPKLEWPLLADNDGWRYRHDRLMLWAGPALPRPRRRPGDLVRFGSDKRVTWVVELALRAGVQPLSPKATEALSALRRGA